MITLSEAQFKRFQALIYRHSGIRLDDRKQTLLASRLQRKFRELDMDDIDEYYKIVSHPTRNDELVSLIDLVTTNETSFYRTAQHFDWFKDSFLSDAITDARRGDKPKSLRIWSAACSIGAEPYTLVFCLHEKRARLVGWKIDLLASDVSTVSLDAAKAGRFPQRMMNAFDEIATKRFFRKSDESQPEYELRKEYRDQVEFFRHNLMDRLDRPPMDCIFLRNVLIYFDNQSKQTVLSNLVRTLRPRGYLVVGPAEGVFGLNHSLKRLSTFLYQKIDANSPPENRQ